MSQPVPKTVGVFANIEKAGSVDVGIRLAEWLAGRAVSVLLESRLADSAGRSEQGAEPEKLFEESDMVVVLGGDGTLLLASRLACGKGSRLLGVNLGGLGFLTEVTGGELFEAMEKVLAGRYSIDTRLMVRAEAISNDGTKSEFLGLNDVVVEKAQDSRILTMDIQVAGQYVGTFIADGLIVATPTGSTAYSLSAGGPILEPRIDGLIATAICAHSLGVRPLVFSSTETLEVSVRDGRERASLVVDGQIRHELRNVKLLRVTAAAHRIGLVRVCRQGFYAILRAKLGWGSREVGGEGE